MAIPQFIEAFPSAPGRALTPLVASEFTSAWPRDAHRGRYNFGFVHALGVWAMENVTVAGYGSHLFLGAERFANASVVPPYLRDLIERGRVDPGDGLRLPERVIEKPVVVFVSWGQEVYGHALIEIAPKVAIAAKALGRDPQDLTFLLPSNVSLWFRDLMTMTGAKQFLEYDQAKERLLLCKAWVATLPRDRALHRACEGIFAVMGPPASGVPEDAFFVTRRNADVTRSIRLLNAAAIERCAEGAGLRIVSPEQSSIEEQARLFRNARLIVGEYGSALLNAVFCQPGAVVGAIGLRSEILSAISASARLRLSYLDPIGEPTSPAGYTVDEGMFARWLDVLLDAAERSEPPERASAASPAG